MAIFIPKKGNIVKLNVGCGVILDVYKNENSESILKILYAKNIVRLQEPEFISLDLANTLNIRPSDHVDLFVDLDENRKWYQKQFDQRFSVLESAIGKIQPND